MSATLHAFMERLVDYAGLFPPAALDMEAAVSEYASVQDQPESWMLGRFIVPAGRLSEFAGAARNHLPFGKPWGVSALLGHREDADQSLNMLENQCTAITSFEKELEGLAAVEVLEIPIPVQLKPEGLKDFLRQYLDGLDQFGISGREIFWEIPPGASEAEILPLLETLAAMAAARSGAFQTALRLGTKLRCGGVRADAFPSVHRIALVIAHCRDLQLALKCTAGLHHPVRHQATEPAVMMHGFLNVFGAGLLAHAHGWDVDKLSAVVSDTTAESFHFEADNFRWRDHTVSAKAVRELRPQFLCGFGSCSFDEPRDDLQNLGLLK